jgi:geranylgeranyl pyrophosphate synthase
LPVELRNRLGLYAAEKRDLIDQGISDFLLCNYGPESLEIVKYLTEGGKRLRGILAILVCETLGGETEQARTAAVAVELAHAASLAHDDILDCDSQRRGRPSLHVQYDVTTAILMPHLVVPRAVLSTQGYGPRATRAILEAWSSVVDGQFRDTIPLQDSSCSHDRRAAGANESKPGRVEAFESVGEEYFEIIAGKTAALFEVAGLLGAIAARGDAYLSAAGSFGRSLGCAYQLADDVMEIEVWLNKPWRAFLEKGACKTSSSLRALCLSIASVAKNEVITLDDVNSAKDLVSHAVKASVESASFLRDAPALDLLLAFPSFAVNQICAEITNAPSEGPIIDGAR